MAAAPPKLTSVQVLAPSTGMSLVDLGKRLLEAAKRGETDTVRGLMSNGAPFTTDWVSLTAGLLGCVHSTVLVCCREVHCQLYRIHSADAVVVLSIEVDPS